jgi:uracil-DNA glycosylase family protein
MRSAEPFVPANPTLPRLRAAAAACTGCELYRRATQTVFGEGRSDARVMLVGEQPGHEEDLAGRPFVGPAGIVREAVYVTNVVKHFKWEPRGKRRIHAKPGAGEIAACRPWLDAEIALIQPAVIVCLGATAAQALLGTRFRVTSDRGRFVPSPLARHVLATVHPSALLRAPDDATRREETRRFVEDLKVVAGVL